MARGALAKLGLGCNFAPCERACHSYQLVFGLFAELFKILGAEQHSFAVLFAINGLKALHLAFGVSGNYRLVIYNDASFTILPYSSVLGGVFTCVSGGFVTQ